MPARSTVADLLAGSPDQLAARTARFVNALNAHTDGRGVSIARLRALLSDEALAFGPSPADTAPPTEVPGWSTRVRQRAEARVQRAAKALETKDEEEKGKNPELESLLPERPFPGFGGSFAEWVAYIKQERDKKGIKPPWEDSSRDMVLAWARKELLDRGLDLAEKELKKLLKKGLTSLLSEKPNMLAEAVAAASKESGGLFDQLMKGYEEVLATVSDPSKLLDFAVAKGLGPLANAGVNALFKGLWEVGDDTPTAEFLAHRFAKQLVEGLVDNLIANVESLQDLIDNFETYWDRLEAKIKKKLCGDSSDAVLGMARKNDTDDKADTVALGYGMVIVEGDGRFAARATDLLKPSGKAILEGSATVLAGKLPVARLTSGTLVPSVMKTAAVTVLVGGETASVAPPKPKPPDAKKKIVLIGGAGDSYIAPAGRAPVKDGLMDAVKRQNPDADIQYFTWDQQAEAEQAISDFKAANPDGRVEVIGHSYGGDSALDIADGLNDPDNPIENDRVITLDPVSTFDPDQALGSPRTSNIREWDNVYVDGVSDGTDVIAVVGGRWGGEEGADTNIRLPSGSGGGITHADAAGMYDRLERERDRDAGRPRT